MLFLIFFFFIPSRSKRTFCNYNLSEWILFSCITQLWCTDPQTGLMVAVQYLSTLFWLKLRTGGQFPLGLLSFCSSWRLEQKEKRHCWYLWLYQLFAACTGPQWMCNRGTPGTEFPSFPLCPNNLKWNYVVCLKIGISAQTLQRSVSVTQGEYPSQIFGSFEDHETPASLALISFLRPTHIQTAHWAMAQAPCLHHGYAAIFRRGIAHILPREDGSRCSLRMRRVLWTSWL